MNGNSAANYGGKSSYRSWGICSMEVGYYFHACWSVRVKEKKAKKELGRRRDHGMRCYVDEFFGWRIQVLFGLPDTWYVSRAGPSKDYIRRDIFILVFVCD